MSDTFFSGAPHWAWLIILYFFVGGLAGGAYFLAAVLDWFGKPEDRPVIRTGYDLAAWGAILSGVLLTIDLGRPLRFWHMLFQSENFPVVMFKAWSPISFGAWGLLLFALCAALSARLLREGTGLAKLVAAVGGVLGFFLAGYTGVLLSVTNRPIWADSPWLGALFLASGASTAATSLARAVPSRSSRAERMAHPPNSSSAHAPKEIGDHALNMTCGRFADWNNMCQKRSGRPRSSVSSRPLTTAPQRLTRYAVRITGRSSGRPNHSSTAPRK